MLIHRWWSSESPGPSPFRDEQTAQLRSLNPDAEIRDWSEADHDLDWVAIDALVQPVDRLRNRSNIGRLDVLLRDGGVYVDHDLFISVPIAALPAPAVASHISPCNCYMAFPQGDERLSKVLAAILAQKPRRKASTFTSGERWLPRLGGDDVVMLPLRTMPDGTPNDPGSPLDHRYAHRTAS